MGDRRNYPVSNMFEALKYCETNQVTIMSNPGKSTRGATVAEP